MYRIAFLSSLITLSCAAESPRSPQDQAPVSPAADSVTAAARRTERIVYSPDHVLGGIAHPDITIRPLTFTTNGDELVRIEVASFNNTNTNLVRSEALYEAYKFECPLTDNPPPLAGGPIVRTIADGCANIALAPNATCIVIYEFDAKAYEQAMYALWTGGSWMPQVAGAAPIIDFHPIYILNRNATCTAPQ